MRKGLSRKQLSGLARILAAVTVVIALVGESVPVYAFEDAVSEEAYEQVIDLEAAEPAEAADLSVPSEEEDINVTTQETDILNGQQDAETPEEASVQEDPAGIDEETAGEAADEDTIISGEETPDETLISEDGEDGTVIEDETASVEEDGDTTVSGNEAEETVLEDTVSDEAAMWTSGSSYYLLTGEKAYVDHLEDKSFDSFFSSNYGTTKRKTTYSYSKKGIVSGKAKKMKGWSVEKQMVFTGKKAGETIIYRTTKSGKTYLEKDHEMGSFIVVKPVLKQKSFTVNNINDTLDMPSYVTGMEAYNTYSNKNLQVAWKSSNTKVAQVDQNGTVRFLKTGTAKITGTYTNITSDGKINGKATVTATIKVSIPKLSKTCVILKVGKSAKVTLKNAADVTWRDNGGNMITVTPSGKNNQTATIKALDPGVTFAYADVQTASGTLTYEVIIGIEDNEKRSFTINGVSYTGKWDYKLQAQMLDKIYQYRLKKGFGDTLARSRIDQGTQKRVIELAEGYVYYSPSGEDYGYYGRCWEWDSYSPVSAAQVFNYFMKDADVKAAMDDPANNGMGCSSIKLDKKIKVTVYNGGGKVVNTNHFLITAFGPAN